MNNRRKTFVVIGTILIVVGVIMFIIFAVQLYDVQTTTTHWAERFMQDYQARTNATNSIPCYMFMVLAVIMVITGIILLCIKPKSNVVITQMPYNNVNMQSTAYCPNCNNRVNTSDLFCVTCGCNLKENNQTLNITCSNCGANNVGDGKFCVNCGNEL